MADFTKKTKEVDNTAEVLQQQQAQYLQQQVQMQQTQAQLIAQQQQAALQQQVSLQNASNSDERRDRLDVPRGDNTYVGVGTNHLTKDHDLYISFTEGLGTDYHRQTSILGDIPSAGLSTASGALFGDIITGNSEITRNTVEQSFAASGMNLTDVSNIASSITMPNSTVLENNFREDTSGFSNMCGNDNAVFNLFEQRSSDIINRGRIDLSATEASALSNNNAWGACIHTDNDGSKFISFDTNQRDAISSHMSWKNDLQLYKTETTNAVNEFVANLRVGNNGTLTVKNMDKDVMQRAVTALGITDAKDKMQKELDKALKDGTITEAEYKLQTKNVNNIRMENNSSGINNREARKTFRERVMEHGLRDRDGTDFTGNETEKAVKNARNARNTYTTLQDLSIAGTASVAEANAGRNSRIYGKESEKANAYKDAHEKYKRAYTSDERRAAREERRSAKAELNNATASRKRMEKDENDRSKLLNAKSDAEKDRLKRRMDRREVRTKRANDRRSDRARRRNDREERRGAGIAGKAGHLSDKLYNSRVAKGMRRISGKVGKVLHPFAYMKQKIKREVVKRLAQTALGTTIKSAIGAIVGAIGAPIIIIICIVVGVILLLPFLLGLIGFLFGGGLKSDKGVDDVTFYQEISDALCQQEEDFLNTAQSGATAALKAEGNSQKIKDALNRAGVKTYKDFDPVIENAVTRGIYNEYGMPSANMNTTIPILTMAKYRIVNGLDENNVKAAIKYATYLWGGEKDFNSSSISNPDIKDVTGVGEDACITATGSKTFTYASWSADEWSGPNHQIKYHAMPGDITIDFSANTGFLSLFAKDNTCAIQGEHHEDIDMCNSAQFHGSTVNGIEHVMTSLSDDCDSHHAIQGDLKEGVVVHKHTPGKVLVSAAYDEEVTTGKGKKKKTSTVHHDAVYEDKACTDENCPGYEHYDPVIWSAHHVVAPYQWHSEEDPGDYNTWYVCDGHCPGHLIPEIDYAYISDYRNLAAMDNKSMEDCMSAADSIGSYLGSIFGKSSDKEDTDLSKYADNSGWNHWNKKDLTSIRDFIGEQSDSYKRGQKMYEDLGVEMV